MREFLHVDDMASACLHLLDTYDGPQQVNVGSGEDQSIKEIASLVADAVGFLGAVEWDTTKPDGTAQAHRREHSEEERLGAPDLPRRWVGNHGGLVPGARVRRASVTSDQADRRLMSLAGTPPQISWSGMSDVTTDPAPTIAP